MQNANVGQRQGESWQAYLKRLVQQGEAKAREPQYRSCVAGFLAQQSGSQQRQDEIRAQEAERDRQAAQKAAAERRAKRDAAAKAAGKVLMYMDPGPPWWPAWVDEYLRPSVPGLTPKTLPPGLGTLALAYGLAVLKDRDVAGRATKNREAFVVGCAKQVQTRRRKLWASQASAAAFPQLVAQGDASEDGGELEDDGDASGWSTGDSAAWKARPGYQPPAATYKPPAVGTMADYRGKNTKHGPGPLLPAGGLSKYRRREPGEDRNG